MAKDKDYATTREVEYSFDEGLSWKTLEISDTLIEVNNIVTEPSNVATAFLVIGQTLPDSEGKQVGVAIAIDFAQLLTRTCTGAATPDENGSDYEKWTPHGYKDRRCLLGKTVTYSRKKRGAICLNGESFERIIEVRVCECTEEDWECDYGYSRVGDSPCTKEAAT